MYYMYLIQRKSDLEAICEGHVKISKIYVKIIADAKNL